MATKKGILTGVVLCSIILFSGVLSYQMIFGGHWPTSAQAAGSPSSPLYFSYVVNIWMENKNCAGYLTSSNTPYEYSLATTYAYDNCGFSDLTSPSQPNYMGFMAGQYPSCATGDVVYSSCTVSQTNIVDRLEAAGLTWQAWAENYPVASGCYTGSGGSGFYDRHFPFPYYTDITGNSARCARLLNTGGSAGSSSDSAFLAMLNQASGWPNYIWFSPNGCNDEHDCGTSTGDAWLSGIVPKILSSTLFTTKKTALIINWDEYAPAPGPIFAGPVVKTGYVSTNGHNTYSLTSTVLNNWGLACLVNDCGKAAMGEFFGAASTTPDFSLTANPSSVTFTAGSSASSTVAMSPLNGFAATVSLSVSSPTGTTTNCSTLNLTGTSLTTTCTFSAASAASGTVTITGTSGPLSHSTTVAVSATAPGKPDFGLSANPASVVFAAGGSGSSTVTLSPTGGFTGTVTLTPSSPSGLTTVCSPGTVSTTALTSTCTFDASSAASGTVTITGTSGSTTHSASISVTASSSSGSGSFDPSEWSLTANSPSSAVISAGTLEETVVDTASSYSGPFYATAQYLKENGFSGPSLSVSTFSAHVNIGTVNTVPGGYLYHVYMGLYFTLPSAVTAGGLTSNEIDGQVQVEQCSSSISGGCDPAGGSYTSNLGDRFGYREQLTTLGANSAYDFVNYNVTAFCYRGEAAWGIPRTPCTLVRVEPGIEGYGVNPFSVVWTSFYANGAGGGGCADGATNPPSCNVCSAGGSLVNGLCTIFSPVSIVMSAPGSVTATPGSRISFVVNATDTSSGGTVLITVTGLPTGASFDQSTRLFSWSPSSSDMGTYNVTFTATDNSSPPRGSAKSVLITVQPASQPPSSKSPGPGVCFQCLFTPTVLTSLWIVAVSGLVGLLGAIGAFYARARSRLAAAKRRRRRDR